MATGDVKRKLTAIFSADVEGYSRLMEEDELATVETLTSHKETMGKVIRQHRGRVVDSTGDNLLAEFASVVDAVQCAVEVQQVLSAKNDALPENRRMRFRIGINSGDVIEEGELIYGDGVNVAARMESLAKGGGISISGTAFDQLGKKLPLGYEYLGEQSVKNIRKPVRVYRVLTEEEAVGKVIGEARAKTKQLRGVAIGAAAVLIMVAGALAIWNFYFRPGFEPASVERMAFPLPDKPSIAVLPFVNMSEDPKQEYFSDGLTDQIISGLSKVPGLFAIARNSTFTYKGKAVKIQKVAEDLGVKYVLEGSVQKTADRIRITTQLIDATTGHHLWSKRYDRDLKDIFAIQDEITMEIMKAMRVELRGDQARIWAKHETTNLEAYEKFFEGGSYLRSMTKEDNAQARQIYEEAIALDPQFAAAHVMLGWTHFFDARFGWTESPVKSIDMAFQCAQKALEMDANLDYAHQLLSAIYLLKRQYEKAVAAAEHALILNPNSANAYNILAGVAGCSGRWEDSIIYSKKSIRLDPLPNIAVFHWLGRAYFMTGQYDEAILTFKAALGINPNYLPAHAFLAASYISLGRKTEAATAAEEVLKIDPKFCLQSYAKTLPFKNKSDIERYMAALRKAGLPETPPLPLPDKPSIAVLPFVNMSGDPEQEYFSDGISEEIITALSKSSKLFVIARESSFSYKGKQVNVPQIARELGVRYILEGSVRKSGDRVRITAQLIDGIKGEHLWAERYDRDLKDIFALQDEITMKIVTALRIKFTEGEQARMGGKKAKNLDVYLKQMEALSLWNKGTREGYIRYGQLAQEIIKMAPESASGYRMLGWNYWQLARIGESPRENILKAFEMAKKALSLDESDPLSHGLLGTVYLVMRQYDKAIAEGERSVELDPNGAMVHGLLGMTLNYAGRPDEAITYLKQGIRLNPFPDSWYFRYLGLCYMQKGQYEEALRQYKKALRRSPDALVNHVLLAIVYVLLDRQEEARAEAKKVLEIDPKFSVERLLKASPWKNQASLKLKADAMHKAGLK